MKNSKKLPRYNEDEIIVLENGQIIEEGTHKELMQAQGKYYELFTTQAKRYIDNN